MTLAYVDEVLTAAQLAVDIVREQGFAPERRPDLAVDVSPERAADVLVQWMIFEAGEPEAYKARGTCIVPQPEGRPLYILETGALAEVFDLSGAPVGCTVWTVTRRAATAKGKRSTLLLGAVRLENGEWLLFRRTASGDPGSIVFRDDAVWYGSRVRRARRAAARRS